MPLWPENDPKCLGSGSWPNGAGKTTLAAKEFSHILNINADVEAVRLSPDRPGKVALAAGRRTIAAIRAALAAGESFTVETTLAGRLHLRTIQDARARGWNVGLAFIGVNDAKTAMARVRERYRAGGHNLPPADIRV